MYRSRPVPAGVGHLGFCPQSCRVGWCKVSHINSLMSWSCPRSVCADAGVFCVVVIPCRCRRRCLSVSPSRRRVWCVCGALAGEVVLMWPLVLAPCVVWCASCCAAVGKMWGLVQQLSLERASRLLGRLFSLFPIPAKRWTSMGTSTARWRPGLPNPDQRRGLACSRECASLRGSRGRVRPRCAYGLGGVSP